MNAVTTSLIWLTGACLVGFFISAAFSNWLKLSRRKFLIVYVILSVPFLVGFFSAYLTNWKEYWIHGWKLGTVATLAIGAFLIKNVLSQPKSRTAKGWVLTFDVFWAGIVYGTIDGLFLNVLPVLAVVTAFPIYELNYAVTGAVALTASMLVTFFYHLGYSEFRNRSMVKVLIGNALIAFAYVASANPLSAVACHVLMHVAAVVRGPETTLQLPPHRGL